MSFERYSGEVNMSQPISKKASTVFTNGGMVYSDGSGAFQPADATAGNFLGVINVTTAATDDDYAANTKYALDMPRPNDVFKATVSTGTLTTAMIGNYYDLTDANGIDVTAQSKNVVQVIGFIDDSTALIRVNAMAGVVNVATT